MHNSTRAIQIAIEWQIYFLFYFFVYAIKLNKPPPQIYSLKINLAYYYQVLTFHHLIDQSTLPDAKVVQSNEKHTHYTHSL
ncbi:unnamed protein product [Paramecium sonneborni]|uniref:Uncharacterized protein n=1 Tax=Paramecium sonneborni TaxID=65129 RepID=A0A8S1RME0_9CILI|nr:unnamed protein product [Paramecium sonneborni]CAD8130397.1 unnamed protein product [Paramecium sonneborni]